MLTGVRSNAHGTRFFKARLKDSMVGRWWIGKGTALFYIHILTICTCFGDKDREHMGIRQKAVWLGCRDETFREIGQDRACNEIKIKQTVVLNTNK